MKKLMISSIILLPIAILMILLISSNVVAIKSHVYVEAVEMVGEGPMVLVVDDEENKPEQKFEVKVLPFSASNTKLEYSIDDSNVAEVNSNGVVRAKDFGETYVTAKSAESPNISATRKVIVTDSKIHRLILRSHPERIYIGHSADTVVDFVPQEAENKKLVYKSLNEEILSVSALGTVTANDVGKAVVEVWAEENPQAKVSFEVECCAPVNGIEIDDPGTTTMSEREAQFPTVKFLPAEANEEIIYSSSNEDIAIIDKDGNITFLTAGKVTFTAKVVDGLGNEAEASKTYICTDGYYSSLNFEESYYEFDYNDYSATKALPINIIEAPLGASKGIEGAEFSRPNVLKFENGKFYIIGTSKENVMITLRGRTYDNQPLSAVTRVKVLRDVESITANSESLFSQNDYDMRTNVNIVPANHTNDITYESLTAGVTMSGSTVIFGSFEGTALIKVSAKEDERVVKEKIITISHATKDSDEESINVSGQNAQLIMTYDTVAPKAVIFFTAPALHSNVSYQVCEGESVSVSETGHITAIKGGASKIKITAKNSEQDEQIFYVEVFVDRTIKSVTYTKVDGSTFEDGFKTSFKSYSFILKIAPADAINGKEITLQGNKLFAEQTETEAKFECEVVFDGAGIKTFAPVVSYLGKTQNLDSITFNTTFGKIDEFEVFGEEKLENNAIIKIKNIDDNAKKSVTLTLGTVFAPADFSISGVDAVEVLADSTYISVEKSFVDGTYSITLLGVKPNSKGTKVSITLAGKTINLNVFVYRDVKEIKYVKGTSVNVEDQYINLGDYIAFDPADTTNQIDYTSSSTSIADVEGDTLIFKDYNSVIVSITAKDCDGQVIAEGEITINYQHVVADAIEIQINNDSNETTEIELTLKPGEAQKGNILVTLPEGYSNIEYTLDGDTVSNDKGILTPIKGGVTVVTIKAENGGGGGDHTFIKYVKVYVNRYAEKLEILQENDSPLSGYRTSLDSVSFIVRVWPADAMYSAEGNKTLSFRNGLGSYSESSDKGTYIEYTCKAENLAKGDNNITVDIYEKGSLQKSTTAKVESTLGEIDELLLAGAENNQSFVIEDTIEGKNTLRFRIVSETITPTDFGLSRDKIELSASGSVSASIEESDGFWIVVRGEKPGGGKVSIAVGSVDKKKIELSFEVYQNAQEIGVVKDSILVRQSTLSLAKLTHYNVSPDQTTNQIKFESLNPIAAVSEAGEVTFSGEGTTVIRIYAEDRNLSKTCEVYLTITYIAYNEGEKELTIMASESNVELSVDYDEAQNGIVLMLTPEAFYTKTTFSLVLGEQTAELSGLGHLSVKKGGYVKYKITMKSEEQFDMPEKEIFVSLYINRKVESITFEKLDGTSFEPDMVTFFSSYQIVVKIAPADAMEGKKLQINGEDVSGKMSQGNMVYNYTAVFTSQTNDITANVYLNEHIVKNSSLTIKSTLGTVENLVVTEGEEELSGQEKLVNVGDEITFKINKAFNPADFVLTKELLQSSIIRISGAENILSGANIVDAGDHFEISYTFENAIYNGAKLDIEFTIGDKTRKISYSVVAPADTMEVKVLSSGGDKVIEFADGKEYNTLASTLSFTVILSRRDGKQVSNNGVSLTIGAYVIDGTSGIRLSNVTLGADQIYTITFRSKDGQITKSINIRKITALEDYSFDIVYQTTGGEVVSAPYTFKNAGKIDLMIRNDARAEITFKIKLDGEFIGVVNECSFLKLNNLPASWSSSFDGANMVVILVTVGSGFNETITLENEEETIEIHLLRNDIYAIEFNGYDMDKSDVADAVNDDIYRGLQQVRVFAKHSYYTKIVDYFKIPFKIWKDASYTEQGTMSLMHFTLSRYVGKNFETILSQQADHIIEVGENKYIIEFGDGMTDAEIWLLSASGEKQKQIVGDGLYLGDINESEKIPFVDPFSEPGYLKIYFGNFSGLNLEDLENDNFGAFFTLNPDESTECNDGAYLRLTATNGLEKERSYNFNVMNDVDGNRMVNITNKQGFLDGNFGKFAVMQTNLYSEGERSDVSSDIIFTSADAADKDLLALFNTSVLVGNGCSINYKVCGDVEVNVGKVFNATIKAMNDPAKEIADHYGDTSLLVFMGEKFYYSISEGCENGFTTATANTSIYISNSIFRYTTNCAIQLRSAAVGTKAYIHNIVVVDCWGGIENLATNTPEGFYVSGFCDVFNYRNKSDLKIFLKNSGVNLSDFLQGAAIDALLVSARTVGLKIEKLNKVEYLNLVFWHSNEGAKDRKVYVEGADGNYSGDSAEVKYNDGYTDIEFINGTNGIFDAPLLKLVLKNVHIAGWGMVRNDININCVYKLDGENVVYNDDHLSEYHFRRVYRDYSIIGFDWSEHKTA